MLRRQKRDLVVPCRLLSRQLQEAGAMLAQSMCQEMEVVVKEIGAIIGEARTTSVLVLVHDVMEGIRFGQVITDGTIGGFE
jgi:hypothetical protein